MDLLVMAGFEVTATCDHAPWEQLPSQGQVDLVAVSLESDHAQTVNNCESFDNNTLVCHSGVGIGRVLGASVFRGTLMPKVFTDRLPSY
jgi:hypothetical protein